MLKPKARNNFDNVSIAYTKSSKTLKSKKNNNPEIEVKKFQPPYFKQQNICKDIAIRAQKEKLKTDGLLTKKQKYDHFGKAHKIVEDLMARHKEVKEKLNKLKQEQENRMKAQCSFQPVHRKLEKYVVEGDIVRRNQIWLQQKQKKRITQKQQNLQQDLSQCTFSPAISEKSKSMCRNRENNPYHTKSFHNRSSRLCQKQQLTPKSANRSKIQEPSHLSFQTAKKQIFNRIVHMHG